MKKKVLLPLCLLFLSLSMALTGCGDSKKQGEGESVVYYTVTYDSNGGDAIEPRQVSAGGTRPDPGEPERAGYLFDGWTHNGVNVTVGETKVMENMTLRATWISAESVFSYQRLGETNTAVLTELKRDREELRIPTVIGNYTVVALGDRLFYGKTSETVQSIWVPHTVTTIGEKTFGMVRGVHIGFDERCRITSLGEGAFFGCSGLEEIPLGEGLVTIPYEAFAESGLTSVRLPESVTKIEENAFDACDGLITVMLHHTLMTVENGAFFECESLKTLFFYGTAEQAEALLTTGIAPMNAPFAEARIYLYAEQEPAADGEYEYWYLDENGKTKIW